MDAGPGKKEHQLFWHPVGGNNRNRVGANAGAAILETTQPDGTRTRDVLLFELGAMPGDRRLPEDPALVDCDTVIPDARRFFHHAEDKSHQPETPASALFLTHAHFDHIEAVAYYTLMGFVMPPIYATPFTAKRLYQALEKQGIEEKDWPKVTEIAPGQVIKVGEAQVTPFSVSHSTPHSVGYYIDTPGGTILHSGDFKLDQSIMWGPKFSPEQFRRLTQKGIDLLLLDSTGADHDVAPVTEHDMRETLRTLMRDNPGKRFIIATMSGYEENLASVAKVSAEFGRKLWVAGWSHEQALSALALTGLSLSDHIGHAVDVQTLTSGKRVQDEFSASKSGKVSVLVTGAQGEPSTILSLAADDKCRTLKLNPKKDIILFCAPGIPGREAGKERLVSVLRNKGFTVLTPRDRKLYSHGHCRLPELKLFAKFANPKCVLPVNGTDRQRNANAAAMEGLGLPAIAARNGEAVQVRPGEGALRAPAETHAGQKLIGFKTRTGTHWTTRTYLAIYAPQPQAVAEREAAQANGTGTRKPRVINIYPAG